MVLDFFKNLVRYRIESVRARANAKVYGATARAKSKVSAKFNQAVDAPIKKAQQKAKAVGQKAQQKAKKQGTKKGGGSGGKKEAKVGIFGGGKKKGRETLVETESSADYEVDPGMATQAIDISGIVDDRAQDVVGWVVALNGPLRGRDFRLVTGRNVIGTAADCDIVLTDPYLSSKHCAIRHEEGRFTLIDLDSTNGTYLNDRRISKEELIDNDKIRVGRTELKFKSLF